MAHAARLNLRMQKELKLLLTDPPYGVSFSSLSDDSSSSSSSLTSIDAHVEGPAGTVYATGVFKVKIQIPERYPFQPPIVTFSTPIYHPNIDTGGRICLDILNLPPKGAWQPSLNISTVLTSIGLLLSEPNPDDGLMHEVSKEYKYNRAAFDHKARSMTEQYALAREGSSAIGGHGTKPSTAQNEMKALDASTCENEHFVSHEGFSGSSRKLSLENSGLILKPDSGKRVHNVPENQMDIELEEGNKEVDSECNQSHKKLQVTRHKCPLKFSDASNSSNPENVDIELPKKDSSVAETENHSMVSSVSLPMLPTAVSQKQEPPKREGCKLSSDSKIIHLEKRSEQSKKRNIHCVEKRAPMPQQTNSQSSSQSGINLYKNPVDKSGDGLVGIRRKKLGLAGKKPLLGSLGSSRCHFEDNKENQASYQTLPSLHLNKHPTKLPLRPLDHILGSNNNLQLHSGKPSIAPSKNPSDEKQLCTRVHHEEPAGGFKEQEELLPEPETVIVLDSEDSEDESVSASPKLSLARKCCSRKIKGSN